MRTDYKELLFWFKTNPDLKHLRKLAGKTRVSFNKDSEDPNQRIKIFDVPEYKTKKSFLRKIWETIWVPGNKLRGNTYTDKNYEQFLSQTSSIMSLSSIGDLICTGPILFYFTKAAGLLSIPFSVGIGYLLLLMSNKAGEFSMNREKENTRASSYLLLIFFGMSLVKTLMSGVGIDLVSRSEEIKNQTAKNYLFESPLVINNKDEYGELLFSVTKECEKLENQQKKLNLSKRRDRKLFSDLQEKMFAKPDQLNNSDPNYLLENYLTSLGPCTKKDLITSLNGRNKYNRNEGLINQNKLKQTQSPISYLYIFQRNKFYNLFNGNPIIGTEDNLRKKYGKSFTNSTIDFNIDCSDGRKDCNSKIEWANPGMAINQASSQFYQRLFNKEWENLGFSFIGFLISVLLSTSATVLLFTASISIKNRASRSSHLDAYRQEYLSSIQDDIN